MRDAGILITFMLQLEKISSLDLPELAPYRTLKRSAAHAKLGIFVVEGDKVLDRLLESDFTVVSVLVIEERLAEFEPRLRARPENIAVFVCPRPVLAELAGFEIYQGVLAIAKTPAPLSLETILSAGPRPRLFVAMDGLSNAENVGLLMRNCVAFGVSALIAGETCCSPFLRRTVRNSMGAIFKLPVFEAGSSHCDDRTAQRAAPTLVQTLRNLRAKGVRCIAAHPHTDKKILSQADFTGDCCVIFGSEGHGISSEVLAACDESVAIPMANDVDSLNVSAAAAVFLYEVNRQRNRI
jgi:tRNA G18 (ribose-2'-O)-methylase SpoU